MDVTLFMGGHREGHAVVIRFVLFYFVVIHFRALRMLVRPPITGDSNWCATPLLVANRIFQHPALGQSWHLVDMGCGEGLLGLFVCLVKKRSVHLIENQVAFGRMIALFCRWFRIRGVQVSQTLGPIQAPHPVVYCSWESWSLRNRLATVQALKSALPLGAIFIAVGQAVFDAAFQLIDQRLETFAWGKSWVYYYTHA